MELTRDETKFAIRTRILRKARSRTNRHGWFILADALFDAGLHGNYAWSKDLQDRELIAHITVPNTNYGHFVITEKGLALLAVSM